MQKNQRRKTHPIGRKPHVLLAIMIALTLLLSMTACAFASEAETLKSLIDTWKFGDERLSDWTMNGAEAAEQTAATNEALHEAYRMVERILGDPDAVDVEYDVQYKPHLTGSGIELWFAFTPKSETSSVPPIGIMIEVGSMRLRDIYTKLPTSELLAAPVEASIFELTGAWIAAGEGDPTWGPQAPTSPQDISRLPDASDMAMEDAVRVAIETVVSLGLESPELLQKNYDLNVLLTENADGVREWNVSIGATELQSENSFGVTINAQAQTVTWISIGAHG